MPWTMLQLEGMLIKDALRIKYHYLSLEPWVLKAILKLYYLSRLKVTVVKMILLRKVKSLIVHWKCSLSKLFTVLNGQEIFLVRSLACNQKPSIKLKILNLNHKKMILRVSMTVLWWQPKDQKPLTIALHMQ